MEIITPFKAFYNSITKMQDNDKQCPHILSRFEALQQVTSQIQQKDSERMSEDLRAGLDKLKVILESTEEFIKKFNEANALVHMVKASTYKVELEDLNKSLTDAFVTFSAALHVHQEKKLQEQETRLAKQERRLEEQQEKLAEQEEALERLEAKAVFSSRAFYCVLL